MPQVGPPLYYEKLDAQEKLPVKWVEKLATLSTWAQHIKREGAGPGSLTNDGLEYHVVDGEQIARDAPWLMDWYAGPGLELARELLGKPVNRSEHVKSAVNLNIVKGKGGSYEWHTDGQPYTALLFACTLREDDGGALVLREPAVDHYLYPTVGRFVIFDGSKVPHAVEELKRDTVRLSVPLVYLDPDSEERPEGLDDHLYETSDG